MPSYKESQLLVLRFLLSLMSYCLLISVRKSVVPHWRGATNCYHIFTPYFTLPIQLVLQLQLQSFSLVAFFFCKILCFISWTFAVIYYSSLYADPKDFRLRTVENAFLLGPLLIYARFSSPYSESLLSFPKACHDFTMLCDICSDFGHSIEVFNAIIVNYWNKWSDMLRIMNNNLWGVAQLNNNTVIRIFHLICFSFSHCNCRSFPENGLFTILSCSVV